MDSPEGKGAHVLVQREIESLAFPDRRPGVLSAVARFTTLTAEVVSFTLVAEERWLLNTVAVLSRRRIYTTKLRRGEPELC